MRRHLHIRPPAASKPGHLICPMCSCGELHHWGSNPSVVCNSCGYALESAILRTLGAIVALSDALGKHACECGHPEMRKLPDQAFHCPACGSEVLPVEAASGLPNPEKRS